MKKGMVATIYVLAACMVIGLTACKTEEKDQSGMIYILQTLGSIPISEDEFSLSLLVILGESNPVVASELQSITWNEPGLVTERFELIPSESGELRKGGSPYPGEITTYSLNMVLRYNGSASGTRELTEITFHTADTSYSVSVGAISLYLNTSETAGRANTLLQTRQVRGANLGAGLKPYSAALRNESAEAVTIEAVAFDAFAQFEPVLTINGTAINDSGDVQMQIEPGEIVDIEISFTQPESDYDAFYFAPRLFVRQREELFTVYSEPTLSGVILDSAEIGVIYDKAISMAGQ